MTQTNKPVRRRRGEPDGLPPPSLHNSMQVELVATSSLRLNRDSARRWSRMEEKIARQIVGASKVSRRFSLTIWAWSRWVRSS